MDLDLKESIDFDFFDEHPQDQNNDAVPLASAAKPPMHPHNTKIGAKTENVVNSDNKIFIDIGKISEKSSGSDSSRDSSPSVSSSSRDNSNKSLGKHKNDAVESQNILSKSSSNASSIRSSLSSSSLLSDSERSNSLTDSHSKSKKSYVRNKNSSPSSSDSDSNTRPTNPLGKSKKQILHQRGKSQQEKAENSSSIHSDSDDSKPKKPHTLCDKIGDSKVASEKKAKRQAWGEVKVIRDKEKRSKSAKSVETFTKGRPETAVQRKSTISNRSRRTRSRSDSDTLSDSDITDVSPIDTLRSDAYGKFKNKRECSRMTSAGDCHPGKLQFRSISDVDQKYGGPDPDYDPDKITGLDLKILMKAVGELEKQKRIEANSRRVMFAPSTLKSVEKGNYTFDKNQTRDIERENHRLLKEIVRQVNASDQNSHFFRPPSSYRLTPSAVNRERDIQRIERENFALLKRLQEVKPTKSICRDQQLRAYESTVYLGIPIAALHQKPKERNMRNCTVGDTDSSFGGRARSVSSVASAGSSVRSVGSSRSSRPSSASRPASSSTKHTDSRPAWSDRW